MIVDPVSENLILCGNFSHYFDEDLLMHPSPWVCQYDGQEWSKLGTDTLQYNPVTFEIYHDQIYAGGYFEESYRANGDTLHLGHIARFDGFQWQPLDSGVNHTIRDMEVLNDELYVVGVNLDTLLGTNEWVNGIAKWYMHPDSVTWGTSIVELAKEKQKLLNVFPNPNDGVFTVELNEPMDGHIILTDMNGREIEKITLHHEKQVRFEATDLPSGMYLVHFVQAGVIIENLKVSIEN